MLRKLRIENFKAFGKMVEIPLAPITLIFGENSAGKSSILQVLNLLKQTRSDNESEAILLPRSDLNLVDLGSFHELLFDHDLNGELRFRLEFDLEDYRHDFVDNNESVTGAIEFLFGRHSLADEVSIKELAVYHSMLQGEPLARFEPVLESEEEFNDLPMFWDRGLPILRKPYSRVKCTFVTQESEWWGQFFEEFKIDSKANRDYLREHKISLERIRSSINERIGEENGSSQEALSTDKVPNHPEHAKRRRKLEERQLIRVEHELKRLADEVGFLESDFDFDSFVTRMSSRELESFLELKGFLPISFDLNSVYRGRWGYRTSVGRFAVDWGGHLETILERYFPLGPVRKPPSRWYAFSGTNPQNVGHQGQSFPDFLFRNKEAVDKANIWLKQLDMGYKLKVKILSEIGEIFDIRLQDLRRGKNVEVSLMDVGFGISQILPFIVQSLAAKKQTISIEQPEIHLHPRVQADLGDLLAEAIKVPLENQFLVETHSEHLVLRLQRLVREGILESQDVSIVYVSRQEEGAEVRQLRLDKEGDFIDGWPGGFFPERLRELM